MEISTTGTPVLPVVADQPAQPITRMDTGLGTTYERWALNRYLKRLQTETRLQTVLEGPGDGMTGINGLNSLMLGLLGVRVSLVLPGSAALPTEGERARLTRETWKTHAPQAVLEIADLDEQGQLPYESESFDLAWNFNVMTRQANPETALAELVRVSRRYILIFVPNRLNYGFGLHRFHHRVAAEPWDHGRVDLMSPHPWTEMFRRQGLRVIETIWLDCPWWPDIVDPGQLIADFFPPLKSLARQARPENRFAWLPDALPYYQPDSFPDVHQRMNHLAYFENSRLVWLKQRFAHHVGVLAEKSRG